MSDLTHDPLNPIGARGLLEPIDFAGPCAPKRRKFKVWRLVIYALLYFVLFLSMLFAAVSFFWLVYLRPVRAVTEGCYRSPQMSAEELETQIDKFKIKTVLNLRGVRSASWFGKETAVCKKMGVELRSIDLSPLQLPEPKELQALIESLDSAPKPILIHCRNGVDRTGFAAVLELVFHQNVPLETAVRREMRWDSGHITTGYNNAAERLFEFYEQNQKDRSERLSLREWMCTEYPALYEKVGPYGSINGPVRISKIKKKTSTDL